MDHCFTIMECEYVDEIHNKLRELAGLLYNNRRITDVSISVNTLMGNSITYTSNGDVDSPENRVAKAKEEDYKNAVQKYQRSTPSNKEVAGRSTKDIPVGLQQWV